MIEKKQEQKRILLNYFDFCPEISRYFEFKIKNYENDIYNFTCQMLIYQII